MRYIQSKTDKEIGLNIGLEADITTEYTNEDISNILTRKFEFMEQNTKTNRTMYPDFEIIGASFEKEDFSGKISNQKIELRIKHINLDEIYNILRKWFKNININIPDKSKFIVDDIIINSKKENYSIKLDSTKIPINYLSEYKNNKNSTKIEYRLYQFNDFVYIDLQGLNSHITESINYLNEVLNNKYILITENN